MERFVHNLKILWRSERLLAEHQLRLAVERLQYNAVAALSAISGLAMLNVAVFFALSAYLGYALAALIMGLVDLAFAAALFFYGRSRKAGPEVEMVKEMRDLAMSDIEEEANLVRADLRALRDDIQKFLRNPVDAMVHGLAGPLLGALVDRLGSKKK